MRYSEMPDDWAHRPSSKAKNTTAKALAEIRKNHAGQQWSAKDLRELDIKVKQDLNSEISTSTLRRHGVLRYYLDATNNTAYAAVIEN